MIQALLYNVYIITLVLTFDQPLYWKALTIMRSQPNEEKKEFDTYPDPYPERLSARLIKCNSKTITLPALYIKLSVTLIRATVSEATDPEVLYI